MTPLEFLIEELGNVERALHETLRHDYGPELSREYFIECEARLNEIKRQVGTITASESVKIHAYLEQLSELTSWIALIERSHLGEFSWPLSQDLRRISSTLLAEKNLKGDHIEPLIHVIAEATGYQILTDQNVPSASSRRPFVIIAFQKSLKHHALFHSIFGHELGHSALKISGSRGALYKNVVDVLASNGPMSDEVKANAWLNAANAPDSVKIDLDYFEQTYGLKYVMSEESIDDWLEELTCDLFGLLIFGPAFVAAHNSLLNPLHPFPYRISTTHPPFAVRQKMLVQAMSHLGWDNPISPSGEKALFQAENKFLSHIMVDPFEPWSELFSPKQIEDAIAGIRRVIGPNMKIEYSPPSFPVLKTLLSQLCKRVPPVCGDLSAEGKPELSKVETAQILYSGWVYWLARSDLTPGAELSFLLTNRLCDHAILQQHAINIAIDAGVS